MNGFNGTSVEPLLMLPAAAAYVTATVASLGRVPRERRVLILLLGAVGLHTAALAVRWADLGHGPFTTLYEILSSNVWSLALVFVACGWRFPAVRPSAIGVAPVLLLMLAWLSVSDPSPGHLPPTYATPLLYVHSVLGKLFLGLLLIAAAIGGLVLARETAWGAARFAQSPPNSRLGELAHRFAATAFVFETLMIIAGAVWAQDAWGRYWAWDPLETWSFLTWLALAAVLHLRSTVRPSPCAYAGLLIAVFTLAFLTFFGVPFVSAAPHKGAI